MQAKKPRVLVTAVGAPPGLNTLRVLVESGRYNMFAADASIDAAGLYQYECNRLVMPKAGDAGAYIEALEACVLEHDLDVIIPCIEEEALCIADAIPHHSLLADRVLLPSGNVVHAATNKWRATKACMELRLPCPKSRLVPSENTFEEKAEILDAFERSCPMPWIVKPTISHGMRGVEKIQSISEAHRYLRDSEEELIVQEFIPGAVGSMYLAGMVYNRSGSMVRSFASRSIRTLYEGGGPATAGISVESDPIVRNTQSLIDSLGGWTGPVCAEWMLDPRDGQFKFIEINPRLWGYSYLTKVAGSPFAEHVADLSLGKNIGPDQGYAVGAVLMRSTVDLGWRDCPFPIER